LRFSFIVVGCPSVYAAVSFQAESFLRTVSILVAEWNRGILNRLPNLLVGPVRMNYSDSPSGS